MLVQSENAELWRTHFIATPLKETAFNDTDPLQLAMLNYAAAMGVPVEGNGLTDNFGRWGEPLAKYIRTKCESSAKEGTPKLSPPRLATEHLAAHRVSNFRK